MTHLEHHKKKQSEKATESLELDLPPVSIAKEQGVEPFLRWAGGKRWLARRMASVFPDLDFERYHEPFLGGGAIFFAVSAGRRAVLS